MPDFRVAAGNILIEIYDEENNHTTKNYKQFARKISSQVLLKILVSKRGLKTKKTTIKRNLKIR